MGHSVDRRPGKTNAARDRGIDYGENRVNIDRDTGIRYGVIPVSNVKQAWNDWKCTDEYYETGQIEIKCTDEYYEVEQIGIKCTDEYYEAGQIESDHILIIKSPYYTLAVCCSSFALGACHLERPVGDGARAYCFDHSWFEEDVAPYPIFRVSDNSYVKPESEQHDDDEQ